jgi:hypothetical protein
LSAYAIALARQYAYAARMLTVRRLGYASASVRIFLTLARMALSGVAYPEPW